MTPTAIEMFLPLLRHLLQIIGGALVAYGYLTEEMAAAATGGAVNVFAAAWYIRQQIRAARAREAGGDPG